MNSCQKALAIKNYYKILKVESGASKEDIKLSYRKMALKYHPDKNQNKLSENEFKEINEAYHTLINENERKIYDLKIQLNSTSTNTTTLLLIYVLVILAVCSFALWYISQLSSGY